MVLPVYARSSVQEKIKHPAIALNPNPLKIGLMTYNLGKDWDIETISLASAFAYHSPDPAELKSNIEGTKEFVQLARKSLAFLAWPVGDEPVKDLPFLFW